MKQLTELQEKAVRGAAREESRKFKRRFWLIASPILAVGIGLTILFAYLTLLTQNLLFIIGIIVSGLGCAYLAVNCPWYYKKEEKVK